MPTQWTTYPVKLKGGWITTLGRLEQGIQAPGSATVLQNYEPSVEGGYAKILGFEKFSSSAVGGSGQIAGVIAVGATSALCYRAGKYYHSTGAGWTEKFEAAVTSATVLRTDEFNFNGNKMFVMVDGVNDPAFFNTADNTVTADTAAPTDVTGASLVTVFQNHIFFAKNNLINFTAPYDHLDYDTGNGAGVINAGSEITGMVVFREELIIFSVDSIQKVSGDSSSDFLLSSIADNTGCLCPNTIQEVGGDILYLGPDGVRFLSATEKNNDFALERASFNIQDEVTRFVSSNCTYSSIVLRGKNQYRLFKFEAALPSNYAQGLLATKYSDQSIEGLEWASVRGIKMYSADSKQFPDREVILFCSDTSYIYRLETGNSFDGVNISAIFESPYLPIEDPRIRKTFYKHTIYLRLSGQFSINANLRYDYFSPDSIQPDTFNINANGSLGTIYGSPSSVYGVSSYTEANREQVTNLVTGSGLTVAVRYEDNSMNSRYNMDYFVLEYRPNERR